MAELSVFIDESGDFGPYEHHAPYYIITLVLHNQDKDISGPIAHLRRHVAEAGFPESHAIHTGPLIRREADYESLDVTARRKLFRYLFTFIRLCPIQYTSLLFKKREFDDDHDKLVTRMSRELSSLIRDHLAFFQSFDKVIVYYDNGQKEITTIVNAVFNSLLEADVRKVRPSDYSLFQAADLCCTLTLVEQKLNSSEGLSASETEFFLNERNLKKNYLKPMEQKHINF